MADSESIANSKLQMCCWVKNLMIDVPNFAQSASFPSLLKLSQTSKEMRERLLPILKAKRLHELEILRIWISTWENYTLEQLLDLHIINFNWQQITKIPPEIGQLINLKELWLINNQITVIPPEIGQLTNLETLNLFFNKITEIPPEIGQLTQQHNCNLKHLILYYNEITKIPPEIGQLINLSELYLSSNQITKIPQEIGLLTQQHNCNLKHLSLSYNKITEIPPDLKISGLIINI